MFRFKVEQKVPKGQGKERSVHPSLKCMDYDMGQEAYQHPLTPLLEQKLNQSHIQAIRSLFRQD